MSEFKPICMTEEYWATSYFSVARHTGSFKMGSHIWTIVNKEGKDIYECSEEANAEGREYAIEPGEPCDLVRSDFIPIYRRLGRERFLQVLEDNNTASDVELKKIFRKIKK